jgi:O-antigen ligase
MSLSPKKTTKKNNVFQPAVNNQTDKHTQSSISIASVLLIFMLIVMASLLIAGPFFRGLFFTRELLYAQAVVFATLMVWGIFRLSKKDSRFIETPLDLCLVILIIAYIVSFFFAVYKRAALEETMKIMMYFIIYLVVIDICRYYNLSINEKTQNSRDSKAELIDPDLPPPGLRIILHLLLLAATVVAIASLLSPILSWEYLGTYTSYRIGSPMGYANTAAAYMMAAYLMTLALASLASKKLRPFYMLPAALMLIVIVLTFSRGAWLLMPPLALLLIFASAPGERMRSFLYLAVTALAAVPVAFLLDSYFRSGEVIPVLVLMAASLLLVFLLSFLVEFYLSQDKKRQLLIAGVSLGLAFIILLFVAIIPIFAPIALELGPDQPAKIQTIEQVIERVQPEQEYTLRLAINASDAEALDPEQAFYVWGIKVLEGVPGYRNITLIDYKGEATSAWEEKEFTFKTGSEVTRLEVHIFNEYPGTAFKVKSVELTDGERVQNLRFVYSRILPERFYDRLFSYSRDSNIDMRFELFRDALKVIRDYPVFGAGGGGWDALFYGYQEREYHSRAVHNHFLEVWIEAGIIGFIAFIGIWLSFLAAFIRNCFKRGKYALRWQYWTACFVPVAALGLHSTIDWNFSIGAVGIFLFTFLGAGRSLDRFNWFKSSGTQETSSPKAGWITGSVATLIGILLFIYTLVLISGSHATVRSQELLERNIIKQATIEMEKAITRDSFRAVNYHNLNAVIEEQLQRTNNPDLIPVVLTLALRAYELEPYNPTFFIRYGDLLIRYIDIDEGLSYIDRIIDIRPFFEESYREYAWPRVRLAEFFIENNMTSEAERLLDDVFAVEVLMKERLGTSKPLYFYLGKAYFLRGEYSAAFNYFMAVDETDRMYEQAQSHMEMIKGM